MGHREPDGRDLDLRDDHSKDGAGNRRKEHRLYGVADDVVLDEKFKHSPYCPRNP
jgi:hypothetical protein